MQTTRLIMEIQHPGTITPERVAEAVSITRLESGAWRVTACSVAIDGAAPDPGPGWHITTCGWCGGEATHEDNCKNDS
jgi:hypothetical protein